MEVEKNITVLTKQKKKKTEKRLCFAVDRCCYLMKLFEE